MSNVISKFLKQNPQLISYAQKGLINLNALARFIKENTSTDQSLSDAAIGMELRRFLAKQPDLSTPQLDLSKYAVQIVTRSNINEAVFIKTQENRQACLNLVNKISQTKSFISLVEGEKEIVIITDYSIKELPKIPFNYLTELGFVSINLPIELRLVTGVYSTITQSLAEAKIAIHSFHTIGGEILILIKDEDLLKTQEILTTLLHSK